MSRSPEQVSFVQATPRDGGPERWDWHFASFLRGLVAEGEGVGLGK